VAAVTGELLPLALGVVLSPVAIMVVIVMLNGPRGRANGIAYVAGWLGALLLVGGAALLLAGAVEAVTDAEPRTLVGLARLLIGILLLALAARQWRARPASDEAAELPAWMSSLDNFRPARALGVGALFAGLKPKNLILTAAAAVAIAEGHVGVSQSVVLLLVYAVLATGGVAAPVVAGLVLGDRAVGVLGGWQTWLGRNNATIMTLLFALFGVILLGNGLGSLA